MPNSRGIDYSGRGATCNRDSETGIRYGIISAHSIPYLWESVESVYTARCPECGAELSAEELGALEVSESDSPPCPTCEKPIEGFHDGDVIYGEEPDANIIKPEDNDGISGFVDSSMDVWVCLSPFYTRASFCSPCAPGAISLGSPCAEGEQAYCFPHTWFEGGSAPYPVYRVSDDEQVKPEQPSEPSSNQQPQAEETDGR